MLIVVAAVIERADRRILIGQRRKTDTSALKWEFPGGKLRVDESPIDGLARELKEELDATLTACVEISRIQHRYPDRPDQLEIRFFATEIAAGDLQSNCFEQIAWVLPKELGNYDFLPANRPLIAQLATGKLKAAEILREARANSSST